MSAGALEHWVDVANRRAPLNKAEEVAVEEW